MMLDTSDTEEDPAKLRLLLEDEGVDVNTGDDSSEVLTLFPYVGVSI